MLPVESRLLRNCYRYKPGDPGGKKGNSEFELDIINIFILNVDRCSISGTFFLLFKVSLHILLIVSAKVKLFTV